jgi:hypothetical protein
MVETVNSGAVVAILTMVKPIITRGILKALAIPSAPVVKKSALFMIAIIPIMKIMKSLYILI